MAAAFFDVLERRSDGAAPPSAKNGRDELFAVLYQAEVPAPSATRGFTDNQVAVRLWMVEVATRAMRLLSGPGWPADPYRLADEAVERYTTYYPDLAATVPEFEIWASLGEHAATRARIAALTAELTADRHPVPNSGVAVARANRGRLAEPVIPAAIGRFAAGIAFPTVAEFQRREADQEHPVAVIVSSRAIALDRVHVPPGTTVVRLEDFDEPRIRRWLSRWHTANREGIAAGTVRALTDDLPITTLYDRLFQKFAVREAAKASRAGLPDDELERRAEEILDRLGTAAFAMVDRGRQHVTEAERESDLTALGETGGPAAHVLGEFFFAHTARAEQLGETRRAYEFLHATFAEYLIARKVVELLRETARVARVRRRGPEPDDGALRALLSYRVLAQRRPIVAFVTELAAGLDAGEREELAAVVAGVLRDLRGRRDPCRHPAYRRQGDGQGVPAGQTMSSWRSKTR